MINKIVSADVVQEKYQKGQSDKRPWGAWTVVEAGERFTIKMITVKLGQRLSLQLHEHRSEHWVVIDGHGIVTIGGDKIRVEQGSHIYIPRRTEHRIENIGVCELRFVEVQLGDQLDENDITRLEDDYQRANK